VTGLDAGLVASMQGTPTVGTLDPAFALLTVDEEGSVDVCLLSRTELRASERSLGIVVASSKARRNLRSRGRATLLAVVDNVAHYLTLLVEQMIEEEGAMAVRMTPLRHLRDDLGIELHPILFRVDERLEVMERWERTGWLFQRLDEEGSQA